MKSAKELRDQLDAKNKELAEIFENAKTSVDGEERMNLTAEQAVDVKRRNDELVELGKKYDEAKGLEEIQEKNAAAMRANNQPASNLPINRGAAGQSKFQDTYKFDHLSAAQLDLVVSTLAAKGKSPSDAAIRALAIKISEHDDDYPKRAFKSAMGFESKDAKDWKAATDPMYTYTAIGTEWIGTAYSNQLWSAIRANTPVVSKIPTVVIPDGYNNMFFPLESTDPTFYKVAEVSAADGTMKVPVGTVTASQATTARQQITVGKMGARVMYSGELAEDALIDFAAQLQAQLEAAGSEAMEYVVIDGDTSTSSNINDIGGTTYSGAATSLFLLQDGLRHLGLITNTGNSRSAAGAFVIEDFIKTAQLMGTAGLAGADLGKISFVVDPNTWYAAMNLPEVKTRDVNSAATIENGFLKRAYGVEIIPSWQMHRMSTTRKSNTAGKVDNDTVANNAYGEILAVRWDQWKLAYRRRMTMETVRRAESDSWDIVALARWGMTYRDTEAAAITYYVGV